MFVEREEREGSMTSELIDVIHSGEKRLLEVSRNPLKTEPIII